jgi:FKBP-type peptidyl-prolyl cis-trans isomerase FklB
MLPLAAAVAALCLPYALSAEESPKLDDETSRINYSLGYQIGGDFKRQGIEMNAEAMVQGVRDASGGAEPKMTAEEMRATLTELKRKVVENQKARQVEAELEQVAEGKKFMEENAAKEGVVTTASGLQYKILEPGTGKTPTATDQVTVNYRGTLTNGQEFDSSYKRGKPASFQLDGVVKGWTEGLQLLKEGGKAQLVIPPDLAYGDRGPLAHRTLIFDVELISVGAPAADPHQGSEEGHQDAERAPAADAQGEGK